MRHGAPAEEPDAEYPIFLTTGRMLAQYQSGTQTRRVGELVDLAPEPFAEMHPAAARRRGIATATAITLATRRGQRDVPARVTTAASAKTPFSSRFTGAATGRPTA